MTGINYTGHRIVQVRDYWGGGSRPPLFVSFSIIVWVKYFTPIDFVFITRELQRLAVNINLKVLILFQNHPQRYEKLELY